MADVMDYAEKVAFYEEKLSSQIEALESLGEMVAKLEMKVRNAALIYMHDTPEAKKISFEKLEMAACQNDDQKKSDYIELIFLRHKQKVAEKIIEATQSALSGIQSMMKYQGRV